VADFIYKKYKRKRFLFKNINRGIYTFKKNKRDIYFRKEKSIHFTKETPFLTLDRKMEEGTSE
jgi:hypothetical protein